MTDAELIAVGNTIDALATRLSVMREALERIRDKSHRRLCTTSNEDKIGDIARSALGEK